MFFLLQTNIGLSRAQSSFCDDGTPVGECSEPRGSPWYCSNEKKLVEMCGLCGCENDWICSQDGSFCCDNSCNGICSNSACSVIRDPDCGCMNLNGCCGQNYQYANDTDCDILVVANSNCARGTKDACYDFLSPINLNQNSVCSGSHQSPYWQDKYSDIEHYEYSESSCDGLDNDCDGIIDEGCDCVDGVEEPYGENIGTCRSGIRTCHNGSWGSCVGSIEPADEICDGLDNNCNRETDEDLVALLNDQQAGVCFKLKKNLYRCKGLDK